ncbi:MAG: hypothetical protein LBJ70_05145 [Holosporales bacterium]|nr:hypothetical protein [Holosporales bacterium]
MEADSQLTGIEAGTFVGSDWAWVALPDGKEVLAWHLKQGWKPLPCFHKVKRRDIPPPSTFPLYRSAH